MKRIVAGLALLLAVNFAAGAETAETVDVDVTHLPKDAGWRVRYHLAKPAESLRFFNGFHGRRAKTWQAGKGLRIVDDAGIESLRSLDDAPFSEATVEFATDPTKFDRLYPLNQRFSDGSEWVNTAFLYAAPIRGGRQEGKAEFQIHFEGRPGEEILVDGRRCDATADWRETFPDVAEAGTLVYFGTIQPAETANAVAVIDPGLPSSLQRAFEQRIPELFAYYAKRTGYALANRAEILVSYGPDGPPGYSGDTLGGIIDFNFSGHEWAKDDAKAQRAAFHFIAHESAHRWNGERFISANGADAPWIHEGGADAFALLAMRDFGIVDDDGFRAEIESALNQCTDGISGTSLQLASAGNRSGPSYSCGLVINMLVDAELRTKGGLFAFWHALFADAEASSNRYGLEQYFDKLEQLAGNDRLASLLRKLWLTKLDDPAATLRAELVRQGATLKVGMPPSASSRAYARKAMSFLMADDCGGAMNFWTETDRFRIGGLSRCKVLREGDYNVVGLAGYPVLDHGIAIYDAVSRLCSESKPVPLELDTHKSIAISCTRPVPARTPYLSIQSWPSQKFKGPAL